MVTFKPIWRYMNIVYPIVALIVALCTRGLSNNFDIVYLLSCTAHESTNRALQPICGVWGYVRVTTVLTVVLACSAVCRTLLYHHTNFDLVQLLRLVHVFCIECVLPALLSLSVTRQWPVACLIISINLMVYICFSVFARSKSALGRLLFLTSTHLSQWCLEMRISVVLLMVATTICLADFLGITMLLADNYVMAISSSVMSVLFVAARHIVRIYAVFGKVSQEVALLILIASEIAYMIAIFVLFVSLPKK